ncbi:MAG: AAA family ATPase [Methanomassiliicoccaceae archaeon]|nr:AAA family ATPase [Methanomassiliicoccaceae archaeon]
MLRRKITDQLIEWKNNPKKKALLIRGARQVGKTHSIDDFGKKNYSSYVYINFEENPSYAEIFAGDRDVDTIIRNMSARFPRIKFTPGDTLIFLDEIQNCPNARTSFKFFTIDGRYDIIGSGSLMGVRYKEVSSYPVGYEDSFEMSSLDFEEFLWAMDVRQDTIDIVKNNLTEKKPTEKLFLDMFNEYFRWHMIVGGMPEAVKMFKETNHFGNVLNVQKNIVKLYLDDIAKYAPAREKNRVIATFRSIPSHLARSSKRFMFAEVEGKDGSRYDTYGNGLLWLNEAGIIRLCYNLHEPALPLVSNRRNNAFKVYMQDTGLLTAMMEEGTAAAILSKDLEINEGAVMENIAADMLTKEGYEIFYFEKNGTLEIDFVLNLNGVATAIEVKSGNNKQSKSLNSLMSDKYKVKRGIKLQNNNTFVDDRGVEHYPIFAAAFMRSMNER